MSQEEDLGVALGGAQEIPRPPKVLLVSTFTWPTAGRLAVALQQAGFVVDAVGPSVSVVHEIKAVRRSYPLSLMRPLAAVRRAVKQSDADLVVPTDDPSRQALHRLYAAADPETDDGRAVRATLVRSLGPPETYDAIYSRSALAEIAALHGFRVPTTAPLTSEAEAVAWQRHLGGPVVLKTDGSWGGRGVEVVLDAEEVVAAWRRLAAHPNPAQVVKRLVLEGSPWPLRDRVTGRRPKVSIQAYVPGRPATLAVTCRDGDVVAAVAAEVVVSTRPTGPATVLKVVDSQEMVETASGIVRALRLSGLAGFDFVLEAATGRAHLIEINPRATPTAHLLTACGRDPLRALYAAMRDQPAPLPQTPYADGLVALFPQEMERDPHSEYLVGAHHDVPSDAADFVARAATKPDLLRALLDSLAGRSSSLPDPAEAALPR